MYKLALVLAGVVAFFALVVLIRVIAFFARCFRRLREWRKGRK